MRSSPSAGEAEPEAKRTKGVALEGGDATATPGASASAFGKGGGLEGGPEGGRDLVSPYSNTPPTQQLSAHALASLDAETLVMDGCVSKTGYRSEDSVIQPLSS